MPFRLPSFWLKVALAAVLVATADLLVRKADGFGVNLALVSLALLAALVATNRAVLRPGLSRIAVVSAFAFAVLQIERSTAVGWLLFALSIAVATLAPRAGVGEDGWRWAQRLIVAGFKALLGPAFDARDILKVRARSGPLKITAILLAAILPVAGGVVFLGLFAAVNPVIDETLGSLSLPELDVGRIVFWSAVAGVSWTVLRPRGLRRTFKTPGIEGDLNLPGVTTASVAMSLLVFNALFALQNGLDIAYLWSGAGLPRGIGFAEYAHRGAYPLIATALLAGLFVLFFLRPGSATASVRLVRVLVVVWIVQNLFLVAPTALRTVDYIEVYSLTRMRIAALLWMALVAIGLGLILWRLLRAKSAGWLINANLAAAFVVLTLCSLVDLGSFAAAWNVRHAREVGGKGVSLDLCYMQQLNGAALLPLAELETRPLPADFVAQVAHTRRSLAARMATNQSDWLTWRWRDARRLSQVRRLNHEPFLEPLPASGPYCRYD